MSDTNRRLVTTTVYFSDEMMKRLRRQANITEVTMAKIIRRAVERELARLERKKPEIIEIELSGEE